MIETVLFDVGGTLVEEEPPGTPTSELRGRAIGPVARDLAGLAARGYRLGAVSNTSVMTGPDMRAALAGLGLEQHLEVIVTSIDVGAPKPDPRSLLRACELLGVEPESALYIGDRDIDEEAATAAGTAFCRASGDGPAAAVATWLTVHVGPYAAACARVAPLDDASARSARAHQDRLTKPPGALGRVEDLGVQLAAIAGVDPPPIPSPAAIAVFAADHGVVAQGVTPWPQDVTAQMVANFLNGGAAINVLARRAGASVTVVDIGVATEVPAGPGLRRHRVRPGTADLAEGPAMSEKDCDDALDVGASVAAELVAGGAAALVTGEMGIGNTTPAAAVIAALCRCPATEVTGRGTGIDDATLARKTAVVERGLARLGDDPLPALVLREVGGLEIAGLAGFITGAAAARLPVVVDGVIAGAALLVAEALRPGVAAYAVAGHRSTEPGATVVLERLGLSPVLDLGLRLGEGTGACLALPVLESAALVLQEMATFDGAGVSQKHQTY